MDFRISLTWIENSATITPDETNKVLRVRLFCESPYFEVMSVGLYLQSVSLSSEYSSRSSTED